MFRLFLLAIIGVCVLIYSIDEVQDTGGCVKTDQGYSVRINGETFRRHMWQCKDQTVFYRYDPGDIYNIRKTVEQQMGIEK